MLIHDGVTLVKFWLHISDDQQLSASKNEKTTH